MSQAIPQSEIRMASITATLPCDFWFAVTALALLGLGLVMVASASIAIAARNGGSELYYLWRQLGALGLGVVIGAGIARMPLVKLRYASAGMLLTGVALLVLVLIPGVGREVNGSMRWLGFGPITLQASEPIKLALIVYVAGYLVRHQTQVRSEFIGFIKPIGVVTVIAGLLLLEPDFGAAAVLFATTLGMLFLGGVPIGRFIAWGLVAFASLCALAVLAPYRMQRLMAFRDPWSDPFDTGFQLTQALIAFGRGEWFGVGLGNSVQKLFYLPEVHTDFIFAVIGEELGLVGACAVIGLFAALFVRIVQIGGQAEAAQQPFAAHLAYGIGLLIVIEAFVNIGVNMGILPTKGLTLPLVSYGSNSILMICIALALVLRVSTETRQLRLIGSVPRGSLRVRDER
ncbi:MAG: putative lipid II flippase FtsW [Gammaproteobacteria bacterium]